MATKPVARCQTNYGRCDGCSTRDSTDLESIVETASSVELCTSRTCAGASRAIRGIPAKGSGGGTRGDRLGLCLCLWLELKDVAEGLGSLGLDSGRDAL